MVTFWLVVDWWAAYAPERYTLQFNGFKSREENIDKKPSTEKGDEE